MPGIPGDSLNGVLSANELLTRCNLMRAREFPVYDTPLPVGRRVAVIGAGNTAMDAMRVCLRLGADQVLCVYRRSAAECPARAEEVHHAQEEGVVFHWLTAPVEILDDGHGGVHAMRCLRMELGAPERLRPAPPARLRAAPNASSRGRAHPSNHAADEHGSTKPRGTAGAP